MDKIRIENLIIYAKHGVFDKERELKQKFIISAVLDYDIRPAGLTDNLDKTVDYGRICAFIDEFTKTHSYNLIESLAENLADRILKSHKEIRRIELEIKKPEAPVGLPVDYVGVSIVRSWHEVYLSLGSNMGEREGYIDMAIDAMDADENIIVDKVSDYIETKPYGYTEQPDFINACVGIRTLYTPQELLFKTQSIEKDAKRERNIKWGPRTLDVDILFYDDAIIQTENLMVPHPQIPLRYFVLKPLSEIAPYMVHPLINKRIIELLEALPQD